MTKRLYSNKNYYKTPLEKKFDYFAKYIKRRTKTTSEMFLEKWEQYDKKVFQQ